MIGNIWMLLSPELLSAWRLKLCSPSHPVPMYRGVIGSCTTALHSPPIQALLVLSEVLWYSSCIPIPPAEIRHLAICNILCCDLIELKFCVKFYRSRDPPWGGTIWPTQPSLIEELEELAIWVRSSSNALKYTTIVTLYIVPLYYSASVRSIIKRWNNVTTLVVI